jgi:phage protein D
VKPDFCVIADGKDITELLRDRLLSIRTTDKPGLESDECEISVDDRDGKVAFPKKGATLEVSLGYVGKKLTFIGKYCVDEIEISGPPQTLVMRGKPANIAATMKGQRRFAWENVKLADIVGDIARRNKWQALCSIVADVPRIEQLNESDMNFITRLADLYGATATVKDGKLIVATRGEGKSGSGKDLPEISLKRDDLASFSFTFPDRNLYGEAQASYHNNKTGELEVVKLQNQNAPEDVAATTHAARHTYPTKEAATAAAKANLNTLNRATMTGRIELENGRADIGAEKWVKFDGVKQDVNGTYLIESVEQQFSKASWITSFSINAGNGGKGKIGRGKKAPATGVIKLPPR